MKLLLLALLLNSIYLYTSATDDDHFCINQTYEPGSDQALDAQLLSEYSPIGHATKTITSLWRSKKVPNENDKLKDLCACAMYKVEQSMLEPGQPFRSFQEILINTSLSEKSYVKSNIPYMLNYKPQFPYASCSSGKDSVIIVKGFTNHSKTEPVHNLYVGNYVTRGYVKKIAFKGVIKEVKMDVLQ